MSGLRPPASKQKFSFQTVFALTATSALLGCLLILNACSGISTSASAASSAANSNAHKTLIVSPSLPTAAMDMPYNGSFTVSGGKDPYQFSLAAGRLPPGLSLSAGSGLISGTPSAVGTFNFSVSVKDSDDASAQQSFQITVSYTAKVSVSITPDAANLNSGSTLQFQSLVSNTTNATVMWSATQGSITAEGFFTAPQAKSNTTVTVTATSAADRTESASAVVNVGPATLPISVSVSPTATTVTSGATAQFSATVFNASNSNVTWSATRGTVSSRGLFTAPSVSADTTAAITATSAEDSSKSATVTVTITAVASVSVTVTPATATLSAGATAQFAAVVKNASNSSVNWSATGGTISNAGFFTAPQVSSNTTVTVTATSAANAAKSASASISVTPVLNVKVAVNPSTSNVNSGASQQFSATVSNTSNTGVTWSATKGSISSAGLYTAPTVTSNTTASVTATSVADSTKSAAASLTITASGGSALSISTASIPSATVASSYSDSLTASGGTPSYSWSVISGSLPSGITLLSAGMLTGIPSQAGSFTFTAQVTDSSSPQKTASKAFTLSVAGSSGGNGPKPAATFFGFTENDTNAANWPTVTYGMQRFWDSPPTQWPSLNTAPGVFSFVNLDNSLAQAYSAGVMEGMYTLARTPPWASSKPSDNSCHYANAVSGGGNGECDAPADLNSDGSGTNAIWKAWITAIATHANDSGYLQSHAHIKYWEIWNEPDTQKFWAGSIAQLARMTEDANCIITGRGVIHESGNGTATRCSATAIDASAQIVMASAHAKGAALTYGQNELYCNNTKNIQSYQLPCPNPANAIAAAIDIVNFHMKPGNETGNNCPAPTPCTPENAMTMYVANVQSILQPAEKAKPLWDGEAAYSEYGFTGAYTDGDMAASFMARFYIMNWSLGVSGNAWYPWDDLKSQAQQVQTSYQQTYDWMANSSLDTPCSAKGTVWSCTITKSGTQYLLMWDTSQTCSNGACTTANQSIGSQWTQYQEMTSAAAMVQIVNHAVPVGLKPVALN